MVTNKFTPELFDTIAVGDMIETWDGVWGVVIDVEFISRRIHDGSMMIFEADLYIESTNLRTYDRFGTPQRYSDTIRVRVRKHSSDLLWAYTPVKPVTVPAI